MSGRAALTCALLTALALLLPASLGADIAPIVPAATVAADSNDVAGGTTPVWAIVEANGRYYVGGEFTEIGGESQSYLAAIEISTGRLDESWRPVVNGPVDSIAVAPDGSAVFVGGRFNNISGVWRTRIAKLDPVDASVDATFNPGANAVVSALETDGATVWAGGTFACVGGGGSPDCVTGAGVTRAGLARIDAVTGVVDPAFTVGAESNVLDLDVVGSTMYVVGNYDSLGGTSIEKLGAVDAVTGVVSTWDPGQTKKVYEVDVHPDGTKVYAAVGGSVNGVVAYDATTGNQLWIGDTDGDVQALAVTEDAVYVGGHGNSADDGGGSVVRNKLTAWDPITGALDPWDPDADSVRGVWAVEIGPSGVLVGGDFLNVGGVAQSHFAAFPGDGRGNRSPIPEFTATCTETSCTFDSSLSIDPDGTIAFYEWDFGDGQSSTAASPVVTLADDSTHDVALTVTDAAGAWARHEETVIVGTGGLEPFLVGTHNVNNQSNKFTSILPDEAIVNDVAVAILSLNNVAAVVTPPAGWTLIDDQTDGDLRSYVYLRVLQPGDGGTYEGFDLDVSARGDLTTATFRGVDIANPLSTIGFEIESLERAGHSAPSLAFTGDATILRHWIDRNASTTQFSAPQDHATISTSIGVGGGSISSVTALESTLATDSAEGAVAVANHHDSSAIGWSLALKPIDPVVLNPIAGTVERVVHISVDGLRPDAITPVVAPTMSSFVAEGTTTPNARTDSAYTKTMPNHFSQLTGRAVTGSGGHGVDFNIDLGTTVHDEAGEYVASAFDVAHDHGHRTAAFVSKTKLSMIDRSWDGTNGAPDVTGADDGPDKIDVFVSDNSNGAMTALLTELVTDPPAYSFIHLAKTDSEGHAHNWNSPEYLQAVTEMDELVGLLRHTIATDPALAGTTAIVLTADHGGEAGTSGHGDEQDDENYTIPFLIWGPTVEPGADLYTRELGVRVDPGTDQVPTAGGSTAEPIRGHDAANVALDLLGLPAIPNSQYTLGIDGFTLLSEPCAVYDSRTAAATPLMGPIAGLEVRTIQVAGNLTDQGGAASCIPASASTAILRVTAADPLTEGNLMMTPSGVAATGGAGVVNYGGLNGLNNTNTVTIPLRGGAVAIEANTGLAGAVPTTDVRLVVIGYHSPDVENTQQFFPLNPCAVADSRGNKGASGAFTGPLADGYFTVGDGFPDFDVVGDFPSGQGGNNGVGNPNGNPTSCGVPATADAVVLNIVSIAPLVDGGHLSVGPGGLDPIDEAVVGFAPLTATMNNGATTIVPLNGQEMIALDIDGAVGAKTKVRVEVLGYYDDASGFSYTPVTPCAVFDTRTTNGRLAAGVFAGERKHGPLNTTTYQVTGDNITVDQGGIVPSVADPAIGSCEVPDDAAAVLINLEAVNAIREGNYWVAAATPGAGAATTGGVLNFNDVTPPKMNNSNAVVVPLSASGQIDLEINAGSQTPLDTDVAHSRGVVLGYYR